MPTVRDGISKRRHHQSWLELVTVPLGTVVDINGVFNPNPSFFELCPQRNAAWVRGVALSIYLQSISGFPTVRFRWFTELRLSQAATRRLVDNAPTLTMTTAGNRLLTLNLCSARQLVADKILVEVFVSSMIDEASATFGMDAAFIR